jgi:hypothetical protein
VGLREVEVLNALEATLTLTLSRRERELAGEGSVRMTKNERTPTCSGISFTVSCNRFP